ncbi:MAG TPA: hypothetical protein PKL48_07320 [Thermodesulfobacteriota bacterium]|nr:hypothetical protein [Deltaproteobacteria bacterium]HNU71509.1 hypothetical protein [Thermodesulfobacteriota bacterium]
MCRLIPAALTILMIPLTFSISKGIGYGFISYVLISVLTGKGRQLHPLMVISAAAFGIDFFLGWLWVWEGYKLADNMCNR